MIPHDSIRIVVLWERVPDESVDVAALSTSAGGPVDGGRRSWAVG